MSGNFKPGRQPRRDPDDHFNADLEAAHNFKDGLEQCTRIKELIEDAPSGVADRAMDFFESVNAGVTSMAQTIQRTGRCTANQKRALDNWESGVNRWLENDWD